MSDSFDPRQGNHEQWYPASLVPLGSQANPSVAYMINDVDFESSSCTSSDDYQEAFPEENFNQYTEADAAENIYMAYRRAKKVWRRYKGKPVRRFRRAFRSYHKGKGRGKNGGSFMYSDVQAFLATKGKGR